jgi:hypothetical protein
MKNISSGLRKSRRENKNGVSAILLKPRISYVRIILRTSIPCLPDTRWSSTSVPVLFRNVLLPCSIYACTCDDVSCTSVCSYGPKCICHQRCGTNGNDRCQERNKIYRRFRCKSFRICRRIHHKLALLQASQANLLQKIMSLSTCGN